MSGPGLDLRGTFRVAVEALHAAGVPHAFIGALPVLAWGRVRATTDIDLVVIAGDAWSRLERELLTRGFQPGRIVGPADPADDLPDIAMFHAGTPPVRLDVFVAKTSFERAVVDSARTAAVLDAPVRLARPEASIVYKLLASRPKDLDDVEGIFEARRAAGDPLDWTFLDHWAAEWGIGDRLAPYRERFGA